MFFQNQVKFDIHMLRRVQCLIHISKHHLPFLVHEHFFGSFWYFAHLNTSLKGAIRKTLWHLTSYNRHKHKEILAENISVLWYESCLQYKYDASREYKLGQSLENMKARKHHLDCSYKD